MSITESTTNYKDFIKSSLPFYHGPIIEVKVGSESYGISKPLLCKSSPYFTAMLDGKFKEGETQSVVFEEVKGVVSVRSFEMFLQWLYCSHVKLDDESPEDGISALMEFALLADMLGLTGVEQVLMNSIKEFAQQDKSWLRDERARNIQHMTEDHLSAAMCLPKRHAVRLLFAKAAVDAFLHADKFKFANELQENPEFASDLLYELHSALTTIAYQTFAATYRDPFTEKYLNFQPRNHKWYERWQGTDSS